MNYTPLHTHSDASPDGAGAVHLLVNEAKRLGMGAMALTDHGTLANAVAFWSACQEAEIKPIMGMEAYLAYKGSRHHLTLLALSEQGFNNLIAIDSEAHAKGWEGGYPLVTMDSLEKHNHHLMALTGCASSALYKGEEDDAMMYVADLVDVMGDSRKVRMETMFIGSHDNWTRPMSISNRMGIKPVITNDTHYPCQHQLPAHQVITQARKGYTYQSDHLWLKSADEIRYEAHKWADYRWVNDALEASNVIARVAEEFDMKAPPSLPHIDNVEDKLTELLRRALKEDVALKGNQKLRLERLRYEFRILHTKGFLDYIYILWDIVTWAKAAGIRVGPGRGSGGGSYVLYLLGITGIDPLEYGLLFERFINPTRADYPDVDVDFESDRRHEVQEYASREWQTIPIATYSSYSHKSAIHDIARVLKIPKEYENKAAESVVASQEFEDFCNYHQDALITYNTMIGQIRHKGKHAAGVVIANRPVPIERAPDGTLTAAWAEGMNTKDLSKVGIVKYDILGLTALSQLQMMHQLTGLVHGAFEWTYDDPKVFDLFCEGDVTGIFQWAGSEGIRELTMNVAPRNFYDLTTCNALYRPGALHAGTAAMYPEFMKSPRLLEPRIDQHLKMTYGVLCYQEQVMAVVAEVMGGDLAQADLARRLLSKSDVGNPKWERDIENLKLEFIDKGYNNGFDRNMLDLLWGEIYTHSGYSYNLSHASAYTMISYQMAWFKVYHRSAFTVAMLQYDSANAQSYIIDAVKHGLRIRMPHIGYSTDKYEMMHSNILNTDLIFLPLTDIRNLGDKAVAAILADREKYGKIESYEDIAARFPKKTLNKRAKEMMERIGAFEGLKGDPTSAIENYTELPVGGAYNTQLEILGYIVPTEDLQKKIDALASKPCKPYHSRFAGFIKKIEKKVSAKGEYTSFYLSPSGNFWTREPHPNFTVGKFVAGTKNKYGHSNDVKSYKLGA